MKNYSFDNSIPIDYNCDRLDIRTKREYYSQDRLTKEDAIELIKTAREYGDAGDFSKANKIKNQLVTAHLHLIAQIVPKFFHDEDKCRDMMQEMTLSIYYALTTYDVDNGAALATHIAAYIRSQCKTMITRERGNAALNIPSHLLEETAKCNRYFDEFVVENGRYPNDDEIIARFGLSKKRLADIKNLMGLSFSSLDATIGEGEDGTFLSELIRDEYDIMDDVNRSSFAELVNEILVSRNIPERTIKMIRYRYGFIDGTKHSCAEVGRWLKQFNIRKGEHRGLTPERVRQEITKALSVLAEELAKRGITSSLDI